MKSGLYAGLFLMFVCITPQKQWHEQNDGVGNGTISWTPQKPDTTRHFIVLSVGVVEHRVCIVLYTVLGLTV